MPRDWRIRRSDIIEACERAMGYVKDVDFTAFQADAMRQDAVVRCIEIIGEAARHMPEDARALFPDVSWEDVVGMRNLLAHEYFGVDLTIVWTTVQEDLPALARSLREK
ncbi:MAG: hypothetical protein A2516_03020 [Alphaproteobacteria bacterium RIFOXYD12_FULL_60_8]|nr:MAG: hypothetical protein A2516_03020 [Alphaproteobacteria bacterium RIFOXYD12_FULL_60_8]